MGKTGFVVWVSLLVLALIPAWASSWYVDGSVSASGDGTAWATAVKKIQEGIDAACHGDTVIVAEGTYVENIKFNGKNIALTSTDPLDPTVVASTIIDGNKADSVVTFSGTEDETCLLSGFTVRNGRAEQGGGVCSQALASRGATIENNTITGNSAVTEGGGLSGCTGTIRNNTIAANRGMLQGGGLCCCDGTIQNNRIAGNSGGIRGGGLFFCHGTIENNSIAENSANFGGGLAWCHGTIENNLIAGNSAVANGGALHLCDGTIRNNIVTGNTASHNGGGLDCCSGTIRNNAIIGNSAENGGGLAGCLGTIVNCVIWGNAASDGAQFYGCATPTYSCIQDWSGGDETNIAADPQFVDSDGPDNDPATYEDNDYRLASDSPCIDAGKNEDWMWDAVDLDGNPRIFYGGKSQTVDMGAYEYGSWPFKIVGVLHVGNGDRQITWNSRPGDNYTVWSCCDPTMGVWVEEASVASQGASTSWTVVSPLGQQKFYRIEMK